MANIIEDRKAEIDRSVVGSDAKGRVIVDDSAFGKLRSSNPNFLTEELARLDAETSNA